MRRNILAAGLGALLALLSACGQAPAETPAPTASPPAPTAAPQAARVFTLPRTEGSLHPILSRDKINLSLSGLIWEGLFALDESFAPQNVLCQSYTVSEDGLTWTFTLKGGVTFSDGSPLTAGEVAASLLLAKSEESRYAPRLAGVKTIASVDGAVVLGLTRPNGALPALLDIPIVKGESEEPLGTGPYVVEGWGEEGRLAARADWWSARGKEPPAQSIPLRVIQEADDLIYAFDTGDISLVTADLTGANALGYAGDSHEVWDYPTTTMVFVGFNCAKGPCADPAVRAALSRGFDRNTVSSALYARHARAAALPAPPEAEVYDKALADGVGYSPQAMADGLEQAGWTKNEAGVLAKGRTTMTLKLAVNTDNSFRLAVAEYLAGELGKAGAAVEVEKLSWNDYEKALTAGDFDLYLGAVSMTADLDPAPLVTAGGALNYGRYADAGTNALLEAYQAASGADRVRAGGALYRKLLEDAPFTPLCFKNQSVLTQWGAVSGLRPTQQDPFHGVEGWTLGT